MKKWEYLVTKYRPVEYQKANVEINKAYTARLNELGRDGWEMVMVNMHGEHIFKREKATEQKQPAKHKIA